MVFPRHLNILFQRMSKRSERGTPTSLVEAQLSGLNCRELNRRCTLSALSMLVCFIHIHSSYLALFFFLIKLMYSYVCFFGFRHSSYCRVRRKKKKEKNKELHSSTLYYSPREPMGILYYTP